MNIHGINYRMIKTIVDYRPIYEGAKERAKQSEDLQLQYLQDIGKMDEPSAGK